MDCREARELLQDELDGRLDAASAARLAAHVADCAACAEEKRGLASLRATFREMPRPSAPVGFKGGVMSALPAGRVHRLPRVLGLLVAAAAVVVVGVTLITDARKDASVEREVAAKSAPASRARLASEADKEGEAGAFANETIVPDADSVDAKPPAAEARAGRKAPAPTSPAPESAKTAPETEAVKKSQAAPQPEVRYVVFHDAAAAERFAKTLASDDAWRVKDRSAAPGLVAGAPSTGAGAGAGGGGAAPADAGYEARRDAARDFTKEAADATRRIVARATVPSAVAEAALAAHIADAGGALVPSADTWKFAAVVEPPAPPAAKALPAEPAPELKSKAEDVRRERDGNAPSGGTKADASAPPPRVVVVIVVLEPTPK